MGLVLGLDYKTSTLVLGLKQMANFLSRYSKHPDILRIVTSLFAICFYIVVVFFT